MANLKIIGKKRSKSRKDITDATGINLYTGQKKIDAIINYGLAGKSLNQFFRKYPYAKHIPIINKYVGRSKYLAIKDAESEGILVPESRLFLPKSSRMSSWIEKRIHSKQGIGICKATKRSRLLGKYYQKMISDRQYELRVHTFLWIPQDEWCIHKRVGHDDQIAWNFHQGGHFQTIYGQNNEDIFIEAKNIAKKILNIRRMAFGAVDLIIDNKMKIYFIEINSSPGFSELSADIYFNAMTKLKNMSSRKVMKFI